MKVLLDECLPARFRHHLPDHEVHSAEWAGFKGLENGRLLAAAEQAGYDVLMTNDLGLRYQQSMAGRRIAIVVVRSRSNSLGDLKLLVEAIQMALSRIMPGGIEIL
jgi:predicted nuclease of predicted toxin-antitoxin system